MLTVFINNINSLDEFTNSKTNNPVLRKNKIIKHLQDNFATCIITVDNQIDPQYLHKVHDPAYLTFLKECYPSFATSSDISWTNTDNGLVPCNFYKTLPPPLTPVYKLSGFYGSDFMTPIYANTYENVMVSANQAYDGASHLYENPSDLVYVLATSPGHHAKTAEYGGYCFVNNIVVAAQRLIDLGKRKVGIIDLDYHAGNGTYEMTRFMDKIVAYSIHCDPVYDYPSFDGFADDNNYVLPPKCDWKTYATTLKTVCSKMNNIDVLLIAFGGDTFKNDPDAIPIGRFSLELDAYQKMGALIRQHFGEIPILITQEGGYDMENIGEIVGLFIAGLVN